MGCLMCSLESDTYICSECYDEAGELAAAGRHRQMEDLGYLYTESDGCFNNKDAIIMFAETKQKWEGKLNE